MILESGTVRVVQGSQDLVFENASLEGVIAGTKIKIRGNPNHYHFGATPVDNVNAVMVEPYAGVSEENASYQIFLDIEEFGMIKIQKGIAEMYDAIAHNFDITIKELRIAGSSDNYNQIITKHFFGSPAQDREFGYLYAPFDMRIVKLRLSTEENAPDGSLTIDMAIDNVYQGVNVTVPANNLWKEKEGLNYTILQGEKVNFKWTAVPGYSGSNWYVEITYQSIPARLIRYDYQGMFLGDLAVNKVAGNGFKFPVKSKLLGFHYEFLGLPPQGSEATIEVLKDGVSLSPPVEIILPEAYNFGNITIAQVDFEVTEIFSLKVTKVGANVSGDNLIITAHTYQVE